jgi:DNA-binding response OmpR family regulator
VSQVASEPTRPKILVVDDEPSLRDALSYTLRKDGYEVVLAANGHEALQLARRQQPDAVVLDVMLPGLDGLQVCRILRAESTVPILLLSAKGEEIDRVVGLEVGADDYLAKPFAMRELLARIRAMLRRVEMSKPHLAGASADPRIRETGSSIAPLLPSRSGPAVEPPVVLGDLTVDRARRLATIGGRALNLRPKEFDLLYFLASHPDVVHSREVLLHRVWGYDFPIDTRTVDVHVRWIRQKIESDPSNPTRLETVRGVGYRLVSNGQRGT